MLVEWSGVEYSCDGRVQLCWLSRVESSCVGGVEWSFVGWNKFI